MSDEIEFDYWIAANGIGVVAPRGKLDFDGARAIATFLQSKLQEDALEMVLDLSNTECVHESTTGLSIWISSELQRSAGTLVIVHPGGSGTPALSELRHKVPVFKNLDTAIRHLGSDL